jgi:hypothetical protein
MTCPKCQSLDAEPSVSWTLCGRKMTPPQVPVWACLNLKCRNEWPREITSPVVASVSANHTVSATPHHSPALRSTPGSAPNTSHSAPGVHDRSHSINNRVLESQSSDQCR